MLPSTLIQTISPFRVADVLYELWEKLYFGRYYLPNGEIFNLTLESNRRDFTNAQSRCVIPHLLTIDKRTKLK
jgi:hypothetical protein